jgi:UDP-N-acetylmuramate dehydrogenase
MFISATDTIRSLISVPNDPAEVGKRMKEYMKRKKAAQPLGEFSAGCVFKNPEKDSAGRLIDAAGCKGMKVGDIEVSTLHANYFINKGKGTCKDFVSLMDKVRAKVKKQSGVKLEPEVRIIGER